MTLDVADATRAELIAAALDLADDGLYAADDVWLRFEAAAYSYRIAVAGTPEAAR